MSLAEKLSGFDVEWEGQPISIEETIEQIKHGIYPTGLSIFHKNYGSCYFSLIQPGTYAVVRRGPPLNGTRYGIARTFGNMTIDEEHLLPHIDDIFGDVSHDIAGMKVARAKLLKLQTEGARKMMNRSGTYMPREVRNIVGQMVGEKMPVKGAYDVPNAQAKIKTTLFSNGEVNVPRHLKKINTTLFANKGGRKLTRRKQRSTRRRR